MSRQLKELTEAVKALTHQDTSPAARSRAQAGSAQVGAGSKQGGPMCTQDDSEMVLCQFDRPLTRKVGEV